MVSVIWGREPRGAGGPWELEKRGKWILPGASRRECGSADALTLAGGHIRLLTSRSIK